MKGLDQRKFETYLKSLLGRDVQVFSIEPLGKKEDSDLKSFGYGVPYLIRRKTKEGEKRLVIETMSANHCSMLLLPETSTGLAMKTKWGIDDETCIHSQY